MSNAIIRNLELSDCERLSSVFLLQGWNKSASLFSLYFEAMRHNKRDAFVIEIDNQIAGYVTIAWLSDYPGFRTRNIPEIKDLNVLLKFRRKGYATLLLNEAELRIGKRSPISGIGVGLFGDYGEAQRLFCKRGYVPDGKGIFRNGKYLSCEEATVVDDDLILYMEKELR